LTGASLLALRIPRHSELRMGDARLRESMP
jgi:hypothetical protein